MTCSSGGDPNPQTRDFAGRNLLYLCRAIRPTAAPWRSRPGGGPSRSSGHSSAEYPDHFDFAWQLGLVYDQLGLLFTSAEQWHEAILAFEEARRTLQEMAGRHGKLVSRMASIQARIAAVDINLLNAYNFGPREICRRVPGADPRGV